MNPLNGLHILETCTNTLIFPSVKGDNAHDYYLTNVYIFGVDTLTWKQLTTSSQILPTRVGHSTVSFSTNFHIFGEFCDAQNFMMISTCLMLRLFVGQELFGSHEEWCSYVHCATKIFSI
ncbi:hypothetical protein GQ457_12G018370 [Hibiscus cannabinus]